MPTLAYLVSPDFGLLFNPCSSITRPRESESLSMQLFLLWLFLRALTSLYAMLASTFRPLTPIEQAIPLWPPAADLGAWLERAFLAPWLRWDAVWYQRIVVEGYQLGNGTTAFHPLFPWLATAAYHIGLPAAFSLMLVCSVATLLLLIALRKLILLDFQDEHAQTSILLLLVSPFSLPLFTPYPESLFLLFAVLSLFWARKKQWGKATLLAGLAALTRQQGIFLAIPIIWEMWETARQNVPGFLKNWKMWGNLFIIPLGLAIWFTYRGVFIHDFILDFRGPQQFIYSLMISHSANQVASIHIFTWPWKALWLACVKAISSPDLDIWVNLILGTVFVIALVVSWKNLRTSYRLYALGILLISFSYHTGPIHPYMGLPRHLLLAFPVFIGLAPVLCARNARRLIMIVCAPAFLFLLWLYELQAWVL